MRLRLPLLLATAALGTACLEPFETPDGRFGTITAGAFDNGGGGYVLSPEAAFYDETDLSYSPFLGDTCVISQYNPNGVVSGGLRTLDAGDYLVTNVSGRTDSLSPVAGITLRVYAPLRPNGIPYVPGDTLRITVPGTARGFPASQITVRTAEAFTHGAIAVPPENTDLVLTWTAAPQPGSQMTFALRYANSFSTGGQNEQLFCSFNDDGTATVNAGYLSGWRTATDNNRSTRVVRVRSNEVVIDARTRLSVISTFGLPLLPLDP